MKTFKLLPVLLIVLLSGCQQAINYADNASVNNVSASRATETGAKPYPYTTTSFNIAKPNKTAEGNTKTQATINNEVKSYYDEHWYDMYVAESTTHTGEYYIIADANGSEPQSWKDAGVTPMTQSEAHGYGMILTAIMDDKTEFDGLVKTYNRYRSVNDSNLMSWIIPNNEDNSFVDTSATDGDLDIAYSFLLADNQWGSDGAINYKAEALRMINAIKNSDFSTTTKKSMPGDWGSDPNYSRSSDWMVSHFRVFEKVTNDSFWSDAADAVYKMINEIQTTYSKDTGLLPDFVIGNPAKPDTKYMIEGPNDQYYSYNACRTPWRIAMDYGYNGDTNSRDTMKVLVDWAIDKCSGNLDNYKAGYKLDGTPIASWTGSTFGSPLTAAVATIATAYPENQTYQTFLNNNWDYLLRRESYDGYFEKTLSLLSMLYISGNWWVPESGGNAEDTEAPTAPTNLKGTYDSSTKKIKLSWNHGTDNVGIECYVIQVDSLIMSLLPVPADTSVTEQVHYIDTPIRGENLEYYEFRMKSMDASYNISPLTSVLRVDISNSTTDIPSDPAATSKPNSFDLSQNKWGGENTYKITADMWYGQNATVVKLYENGNLIKTVKPAFDTPSAQKVEFSFTGKAKGTYIYKVDAINQHGTTTSSNFTYTVTQ